MSIFSERKIDCHTHVLDPVHFPYGKDIGYHPSGPEVGTPPQLQQVMQSYGVRHCLLVQPNSGYGSDNSCLLDAIARGQGRLKGSGRLATDFGVIPVGCGFKEHILKPNVVPPSLKSECTVMQKLSALALIVMISAAPLPALAYTQEDADACTPDAFRLCQQAIPDADRVTLCLIENRRQLSPACTTVFNRTRATSAARERPANIQKTKF